MFRLRSYKIIPVNEKIIYCSKLVLDVLGLPVCGSVPDHILSVIEEAAREYTTEPLTALTFDNKGQTILRCPLRHRGALVDLHISMI